MEHSQASLRQVVDFPKGIRGGEIAIVSVKPTELRTYSLYLRETTKAPRSETARWLSLGVATLVSCVSLE